MPNRPGTLIIMFAVYAVAMALMNPPFEAPDEPAHLNYINYVSTRLALPNQAIPEQTVPGEGSQPPLYYMAGALATHLLLTDHEVNFLKTPNRESISSGGTKPNVPRYDHRHSLFVSKSDGYVFYLLRLLTITFSVGTLWILWKILGLMFDEHDVKMLGMLFAVSLPQFAFIAGTINNDAAAVFMSSLAIFWLIIVYRTPENWCNYLVAGVLFGLGFLVKIFGVVLAPGIATVYLLLLLEKRIALRRLVGGALLFCTAAIVVGSYPFVRAWILYGDPTMSNLINTANASGGGLRSPLTIGFWFPLIPRTLVSFVGTFGWMNYRLPIYGYLIHGVIIGTAMVGVYWVVQRRKISHLAIMMAVFFLGNLLGVLYWNLRFEQAQGRYYFPSLPVFAAFIAVGLGEVSARLKGRFSLERFYQVYTVSLIVVGLFSLVWLARFSNAIFD